MIGKVWQGNPDQLRGNIMDIEGHDSWYPACVPWHEEVTPGPVRCEKALSGEHVHKVAGWRDNHECLSICRLRWEVDSASVLFISRAFSFAVPPEFTMSVVIQSADLKVGTIVLFYLLTLRSPWTKTFCKTKWSWCTERSRVFFLFCFFSY